MASTIKRPGLRHHPFVWRMTRAIMMILFHRAGRRVLLTRLRDPANPSAGRWLASDISPFLKDMKTMAHSLRPTAKLEQFTYFGNRLMVELTIYTLAAYRVLLARGAEKEYAASLVADIGWLIYALGLKMASLPFRLTTRSPERRLKRSVRFLLRFPFGAPGAPGYEVYVKDDGTDLITHFTHCPPQSFVRDVVAAHGDKGDLDAFYQSWCLYDWPGADIIASDGAHGHYQRTKTLSRGDKVCDMCWRARAIEK